MIRTVRPGRLVGTLRAPPSKSYTHRALVTAFLSNRPTRIRSPLDSEDTRATARGLCALGAEVHRGATSWTVRPGSGPRRRPVSIDCRESGTTLRLLTAVAALGQTPVRFTGQGRLPARPMGALFDALRSLGAKVRREHPTLSLPFTVQGPIHSGTVSVSAEASSQPVSAMLLALSSLARPSHVRLGGTVVSAPYIEATTAWLGSVGATVERRGRAWIVAGGQYAHRPPRIPGDASSAAYLWAAGAATGGKVRVLGIDPAWPQADLAILEVLRRMGADVRRTHDAVTVGGALMHGIEADLTDSPDLYPLVGALASIVPGEMSRLIGADQVRAKESDRRRETARLVRSLGGRVGFGSRSLEVRGTSTPRPLDLVRLTDHRLVMSSAVAALAARAPSRIGDARAVRKSFPGFWVALSALRHGSKPL